MSVTILQLFRGDYAQWINLNKPGVGEAQEDQALIVGQKSQR
jgi:hypothetical protein